MFNPFAERTHEKMKEVLMSPEAPGPTVHYYMIRGGTDKTNITVWETGTIGGEYIKTYGHYHVGDISETYTLIQGTGILLLQKRKKDSAGKPLDDEIEEFKALAVQAGDKIFISPEIGHLMVNTGPIWLVTSDDSPVYPDDADPVGRPGHADYEPVKKMGGFAYFVVDRNGQPTLVKNPRYKIIPPAKIEKYSKA